MFLYRLHIIKLLIWRHKRPQQSLYRTRAHNHNLKSSFPLQTLDERNGIYRPSFFNAGGDLYLVVPNFSVDVAATMAIYINLVDGVFIIEKELPSHSSYGVSVFWQRHDVYVYIWQRLNVTYYDGTLNTLAEHLSWSRLFKWV